MTPTGDDPEEAQQVDSAASPEPGPNRGRSFGATLRDAARRTPIEDDPLARRLARLVDSVMTPDGGGTLPWRLRQLVRLVLSRGGEIDWVQLASDLDAWDRDDRSVQQRWAADFFRIAGEAEERQSAVASTS
jgi:CRISPR type I-E-associated protein CasB/Cse2